MFNFLLENFKDVKSKWIRTGADPAKVDDYIEKYKNLKNKNLFTGSDKDISKWGKQSFARFTDFIDDVEDEQKHKFLQSKDNWKGSPEYQAYEKGQLTYFEAHSHWYDRVNHLGSNPKKEEPMAKKEEKWWDSKQYQDYLKGDTDHFSYDDWWKEYQEGKDRGIERAKSLEKTGKPPYWDDFSKEDRKFYKKFMKQQRRTFKEYTKIEYAKVEYNHPNLVIHMTDKTTDFLKPIYANLKADILHKAASPADMIEAIQKHDRIIMMGHGGPSGLFGSGYGLIINDSLAKYLEEKDNSIFIWCNADKYVEHNKLKGFYTGMFVSEVGEANMMKIEPPVTQADIDFSNNLYAKIVGSVINGNKDTILAKVKAEYNTEKYPENRVIKYNEERQYKA
jgi:hypothetical protein